MRVAQIRTPQKRVRIRSPFDPRWTLAFVVALLLSLAYYALLIWGGVWLVRLVMAALTGL